MGDVVQCGVMGDGHSCHSYFEKVIGLLITLLKSNLVTLQIT